MSGTARRSESGNGPLAPDAPTVLILGGTGEARALAALLVDAGRVRVVSSLAGRVARPRLPVGEVRVGGFGGIEGLAAYLREERVAVVVDATHPFAEQISGNAAAACAKTGTPLLRLQRPGWEAGPGDDWHWVDSLDEAAALLPSVAAGATATHAASVGSRVFLTTGRQGLAAFRDVADAFFLIRCVDRPEPADLPPHHELLLDRGPYTVDGELALIDAHQLDVVITKDSGGELTVAKLEAARKRAIPVIVVRRPQRPDLPEVATADAAAAWVNAQR